MTIGKSKTVEAFLKVCELLEVCWPFNSGKMNEFLQIKSCALYVFILKNAARKRKFSVIVAEGAPFYKVC